MMSSFHVSDEAIAEARAVRLWREDKDLSETAARCLEEIQGLHRCVNPNNHPITNRLLNEMAVLINEIVERKAD